MTIKVSLLHREATEELRMQFKFKFGYERVDVMSRLTALQQKVLMQYFDIEHITGCRVLPHRTKCTQDFTVRLDH